MITTVVFDVGETLVDETRHWGEWADWMGIPRLTFFAVLGGVIAGGQHHRAVFERLRPGFDVAAAEAARARQGWRYAFQPADFYADAAPCLAALKAAGLRVGLAGNQPEAAESALAALAMPVDFIGSSAGWGVEKPSTAFFAKVAEAAGATPAQIAYVGDRIDNDVGPARAAGMTAVFLRRGPWAYLQAPAPGAADADIILDSLAALPEAINARNARNG